MNTRKSLLLILLICAALLSASCAAAKGRGLGGGVPGSGNVKSETRDLPAFSAITAEYPVADVIVRQGDQDAIQIEAEDNLISQITTQVSSGRLSITNKESDWNARVNPSKPVKITVTVRDLSEIDLAAPVGTLQLVDFKAPALKFILSGGAQVNLTNLEVDLLDVELSGAGDIQATGTAKQLKLVFSGVGNFNAPSLQTDTANIELSGMGSATVGVSSELTANVSGAGSVNYYGNPRIQQTVSGAGSVRPAK